MPRLKLVPSLISFKLTNHKAYKKPFHTFRSVILSRFSILHQYRTNLFKELTNCSKLIQQQASFSKFYLLLYRTKLIIKPMLMKNPDRLNHNLCCNLWKNHKLNSHDCIKNYSEKTSFGHQISSRSVQSLLRNDVNRGRL